MRYNIVTCLFLFSFLKLDHVLGDTECFSIGSNISLASTFHFFLESSNTLIVKSGEMLNDALCILLEGFAEHPLFRVSHQTRDFHWLVVGLKKAQFLARRLRVHSQIKSRSISNTNTLNPAVRGEGLEIPAITGVVSHFFFFVLTESEFALLETDLTGEKSSSTNKICKSLVLENTSLQSFTDCHGITSHWSPRLSFARIKKSFDGGNFVNFRVSFLSWVDKMLDFA
mmetsp:Transcript_33677/g.52649  ORF Transcript_33677/g.52649 Transcript_33677/m.52649 type:complete len:227 (+) Transcript_33677:526-1206(+)